MQLATDAPPAAAPGDDELSHMDMLDSVDDPGDTDSPDVSQLTWPSANRIITTVRADAYRHGTRVHTPTVPGGGT